ncbi:MAG: tetratricopeptide repeat protein [Streptosporangiaceae bacterium]
MGEHPFTLACAVNLSIGLRAVGDLDRACELDSKTLEALRRVVGPDYPYALCGASNMSNNLAKMARSEEARDASAEVLRVCHGRG